jgi:uncharacterized membrane protein
MRSTLRTAKAFLFISFGAIFVIVHWLLAQSSWSHAAAMSGAVQLSIIAALVLTRTKLPHRTWIALAITAFFCIAALVSDADSLLAKPGIPHALACALLLLLFAASLRPGRESFITEGVRKLQDPLPANVVAYTRAVTWAWCLFFIAQLAIAAALALFISAAAWSFFVTEVSLPLVLAMFAGEYAYRVAFVPNRPRASLATVVRAFAYGGAAREKA